METQLTYRQKFRKLFMEEQVHFLGELWDDILALDGKPQEEIEQAFGEFLIRAQEIIARKKLQESADLLENSSDNTDTYQNN